MERPVTTIEVGDRVEHDGREGFVEAVLPSGICVVWFVNLAGGVSAPMNEFRLVRKHDVQPEPRSDIERPVS